MSLFIRTLILMTIALPSMLFLTSCESEDDNKVAEAQECLDRLKDSSAPSAAQNCMNKVAGINTVPANVIKCSASFFIGEITTSDIIATLDAYTNATAAAKEAILITGLVQKSSGTADTARAATTYGHCEATGIPGLVYIASISRMGTIMEDAGGVGTPEALIDACIATPGSCDDAAIGEMVTDVADLYCVGDAKDSQICSDLSSAIANGGGDPAAIAQALYGYLNY